MIPRFLPNDYLLKQIALSLHLYGINQPHIQQSLERTQSESALGLPNFLFYYWATNITKLTIWTTTLAFSGQI